MQSPRCVVRGLVAAATVLSLASCGGGTLEPFVSCGAAPAGSMSADVRSRPWLANSRVRASMIRVSGRVASVLIDGTACTGNTNPVRQLQIRVIRLDIDTGSYLLGAADQRENYTASGIVLQEKREFRSDLSDNLGIGTGVIRFTTLSADRVRGTFEFVAVPMAGVGSRDRVRVTSGSFDIPVTP